MSLLTLVLLLPLLGCLVTLFTPREKGGSARLVSLAVALATFALSLGLIGPFTQGYNGRDFHHAVDVLWISSPVIHFHLGLDGISLWLVLLSTLLTPLVILASWNSVEKRVNQFFALILLLEFALIGVFSALDLFLFYVFYELTLVPTILLIGGWGGDRRMYAAVKFFLYTLAGSLMMLAGILFTYVRSNQGGAGTLDYPTLAAMVQNGSLAFSREESFWLFLAFLVAFAVKFALVPLHTWLPDAYSEAPTAATVLLAAVMTKMGTYGVVRFCLPLFPEGARELQGYMIALGIIGIIYGALVALVQQDIKRLIAYSSISHIGFIVIGMFSFTQVGLDGAVYQMICHGVSTGALFLLAGFLIERRGALEIAEYGGVAEVAPNLAAVFLIATLASIGLPLLCNFVGEYLTLQGIAFVWTGYAAGAAIGVILSACYMLWMYQRTFLGKASDAVRDAMPDLQPREWAAVVPLLLLMVYLGTVTQSVLPVISASNAQVLQQTGRNQEIRVKHEARPPAGQEVGRGQ